MGVFSAAHTCTGHICECPPPGDKPWCVMYSLAGLLIVVLLWVCCKCQLCSHGDARGVSGNCVCRHLASASFLRELRASFW